MPSKLSELKVPTQARRDWWEPTAYDPVRPTWIVARLNRLIDATDNALGGQDSKIAQVPATVFSALLDGNGKVKSSLLPTAPAPPVTSVFGRTGVITAEPGDYFTSQIPEDGNLYFTPARTLSVALAGLNTSLPGLPTATDTILQALGRLTSRVSSLLESSGLPAVGDNRLLYLDNTGTATGLQVGTGLQVVGGNLQLEGAAPGTTASITWESSARTSNFTATAGTGYTTTANLTATLPDSPTLGNPIDFAVLSGTLRLNPGTQNLNNINRAHRCTGTQLLRLVFTPSGWAASEVLSVDYQPSDFVLSGWWDASDASTFAFSSGNIVQQWNDKSTNARHLTQGTAANRPSRSGNQNGLSTVVFNGSNNSLTRSDNLGLASGAARTVFVVGRNSSAASGYLCTWRTSALVMPCQLASGFVYSDGVNGPSNASVSVSGVTSYYCAAWILQGGQKARFLFNGVELAVSQSGNVSSESGGNGFILGGRLDFGGLMHGGDIAELWVIPSATLSSAELTGLYQYAKEKWGL